MAKKASKKSVLHQNVPHVLAYVVLVALFLVAIKLVQKVYGVSY